MRGVLALAALPAALCVLLPQPATVQRSQQPALLARRVGQGGGRGGARRECAGLVCGREREEREGEEKRRSEGGKERQQCVGRWQFGQAGTNSTVLQLECAEKLEIVRMERDRFLIVSSVEQASANINHD